MFRDNSLHPSDDLIERYAMGNTPEDVSGPVEEHLLTCGRCRERVEASSGYIAAMRGAASQIRAGRRARDHRPLLALAATVLLAAGVWVWSPLVSLGRSPVYTVQLSATRGAGLWAHAPADRQLQLAPDRTGLPGAPAFQVEVVDALGSPVWHGEIRATQGYVTVPAPRPGTYFVRIYGLDRTLLREYGLEIGR
jgi:hypothetical protein